MNLRQMEVFRAVMLTGRVSAAAELLHVSQPAVSKSLSLMQRHVGFALFERVKGRLLPTPEAQELIREIEALWRGVEHVRDVSRSLAAPRGGTLGLAVSASLAPCLIPRALSLLADRYPELRVRMEIVVGSILTDALLDHSADIGVALLPTDNPNLARVRSYQCGFACVMPPRHRLAKKKVVTPADLVGERLIGSPPDTPYGQALLRAYGAEAGSLDVHMHVRSSASACWLVQAGGHVAVVDRAAVSGSTFAGLTVRPFRCRERLPVALLRNRFRPLSIPQQAFCEVFDNVWREQMRD